MEGGRRLAPRRFDEDGPPPSVDNLHRRCFLPAMKFTVTVDRDESGAWVVECPAVPGCASQGKTKAEALKNIEEAIELCLEVRAERGLPLTIETKQVTVAV